MRSAASRVGRSDKCWEVMRTASVRRAMSWLSVRLRQGRKRWFWVAVAARFAPDALTSCDLDSDFTMLREQHCFQLPGVQAQREEQGANE